MFKVVVIVLMLLSWEVDPSRSGRRIRSIIDSIIDSRAPATLAELQASSCIGCSKKITLTENDKNTPIAETYLTEETLTALRVEYVKTQILKKLRLKEKPMVSPDTIPNLVKENYDIMPRIYEDDSMYSEDFYAKTTRAIIFPYEDAARCVRKIRHPSACIPFQLPSDLLASDVSSAELWFYKIPDQLDSHNQTFVISEVAHWDTNKSFQKTKPIAITETSLSEGWLKVDVAYVIRNWLEYQDSRTHAINVACKTCGMDIHTSPISFETSTKPFLVISTDSQKRRQQQRRNKRESICGPSTNECCRESLYISFADIGWNDWIIKPDGYHAYFCKGSCAAAASLTLSGSQHSTLLHKVMYGPGKFKAAKLEITPCCAPSHYKPLQLVIKQNKTLTTKILCNMIVDSCGCM